MNIYLWKEDIEDRGIGNDSQNVDLLEYGKDYDVVNDPDKFQLYIDGDEIKSVILLKASFLSIICQRKIKG